MACRASRVAVSAECITTAGVQSAGPLAGSPEKENRRNGKGDPLMLVKKGWAREG